MEHPLIPNLDNLTAEELSAKISELNKKLGIAYRTGNSYLCVLPAQNTEAARRSRESDRNRLSVRGSHRYNASAALRLFVARSSCRVGQNHFCRGK